MKEGSVIHVPSPDGTPIGYLRTGTGRPLVMVHGSPADHSTFAQLAPLLEQSVSPCLIDRRGRGMSGDAASYAHEREFEDAAAVVDSFDQGADLFGHSYGGVVALEAARLATKLRRLVLYEPWIGRYPDGFLDKIAAMADAGDSEGIVTSVFKVADLSDADIEMLRARPSWKKRLELALVTVREARAEDAYRFDPNRFARIEVPTLLFLGDKSPPSMRATVEQIAEALPDARIEILPGQEHIAHVMAPDMVARATLDWLTAE